MLFFMRWLPYVLLVLSARERIDDFEAHLHGRSSRVRFGRMPDDDAGC